MAFQTTLHAFTEMISERGIHHSLGLTSEQVRNYRSRLNKGDTPSQELMAELLQLAGYQRYATSVWSRTGKSAEDLYNRFIHASHMDPTNWDHEMKQFIISIFHLDKNNDT